MPSTSPEELALAPMNAALTEAREASAVDAALLAPEANPENADPTIDEAREGTSSAENDNPSDPIPPLAKREVSVVKPHTTTYIVAACVALLVILTMLGGVLTVGDHLMGAHPILGWVFYALIIALVVVGIIVPIAKVSKRPIFSLYQLRDEQGHAKQRRCKMLVDNLTTNTNLSDEDVAYLLPPLPSEPHRG